MKRSQASADSGFFAHGGTPCANASLFCRRSPHSAEPVADGRFAWTFERIDRRRYLTGLPSPTDRGRNPPERAAEPTSSPMPRSSGWNPAWFHGRSAGTARRAPESERRHGHSPAAAWLTRREMSGGAAYWHFAQPPQRDPGRSPSRERMWNRPGSPGRPPRRTSARCPDRYCGRRRIVSAPPGHPF